MSENPGDSPGDQASADAFIAKWQGVVASATTARCRMPAQAGTWLERG